MSKASKSEHPDPERLKQRARVAAKALDVSWDGLGGVFKEQAGDGRSIWRVYEDWGCVGGSAVFDAVSEDLLSMEETPPDREGPPWPVPPHLVPSDEELVAFAREKLAALGWETPAAMATHWDDASRTWRVSATAADGGTCLVVGGRRGNLRIRAVSRRTSF
jgi:hypothetical protein